MEKKLKEYKVFIAKAAEHPERGLVEYHREMVGNFQHERLAHLIIMLFFVFISLCLIGLSIATRVLAPTWDIWWLTPLYAATVIVVVVTGFYVKHYYVLENGVQELYKYSEKLAQK